MPGQARHDPRDGDEYACSRETAAAEERAEIDLGEHGVPSDEKRVYPFVGSGLHSLE
jgi:hypothetical protein